MPEIRGLGKGIRALIPEGSSLSRAEITKIPLESIRVNRFQPRKALDDIKVRELADSIRESGLIYPLLVRKTGQSGLEIPTYELIAGERRFRALKQLGETEAPVIIRDASDLQALEWALIENLQREDLNPLEQAAAYHRLCTEFSLSQEQISTAVGKDRATVANTLRLLKLAKPVQDEVTAGRLTLGHARAILALESARAQEEMARRAVAGGLSVRQVERLVREAASEPGAKRRERKPDPHRTAAEQKLQRSLGTQVTIFHGRTRGWIRIAYYSLKDLDRLLDRLGK